MIVPNLPWSGYEKYLHPKQCLFMSIDAIGSTRLKTALYQGAIPQRDHNPYPWVDLLLDFLPETQVLFAKAFNVAVKSCPKLKIAQKCLKTCAAPIVWKFIGDEVVLMSVLECKEQLY